MALSRFSGFMPLLTSVSASSGSVFQLHNPQSGKCVDAEGGVHATSDGTNIELWACNGGANQQWELVDGALRNPQSGKCLDAQGGVHALSDGTNIELWACNGGGNQHWEVVDGALRNPQSGKCLDAQGGVHALSDGTNIELWECNGGRSQQFVQVPDDTPTTPAPEPTPEECPAICSDNSECRVSSEYAAIYHMQDSERVCYHGCSVFGWCGATDEHFSGGTNCCGCAPAGTDFSLSNGYDGQCSDDTPTTPAPEPTPEECPAICSDNSECRVSSEYAAIYHMQDSERVCYHGCSVFGWCGATDEHFSGGTNCCGCAPAGTDFSLSSGYDGSCSDVMAMRTAAVFV